MRANQKKISAQLVILFIVIALVVGFITDAIWDGIDRLIYPEKYHEIVVTYAKEYAVPKELVFAVIKVESNFESDAVSSVGAIGLMQMLPDTYSWLASKNGDSTNPKMLYDPDTSIRYGTYYLQYLYSKFGSWEKALIAYNWGEGNFSRFLEEHEYVEGEYSSIPVSETRNYVKKVMHHWNKYVELYNN